MNPKHAFTLALLITLLIASNFFIVSNYKNPERKTVLVTRVIDGDTLIVEEDLTLRLLNINTPEKNHPGYKEALEFIKQFENQTVEIEEMGRERYGRTLARVYTPEYLNLELVELGLATKFLVHESELKLFNNAENDAVANSLGIFKKSKYFNCIDLKINPEEEIIKIKSKCGKLNFDKWLIKDESRKEYKFENLIISEINIHTEKGEDNETDIFLQSPQDVWNNDRDTVYIFDSQQKIVHHESYSY
ncbi:thermonuclease family protein [Candidatus Pacearchaeota archaeon]|nr:thermonuclease family protein [Candidatus Pacearchaeota archaeon]